MRKCLLIFLAILPSLYSCRITETSEVEAIVTSQKVVFHEPPSRIPAPYSVDAPLMGNGYSGVALSGPPENLVFHIARNDFWRLRSAHDEAWPLVLGLVRLSFPSLAGASYRVEQSLYDATTTGCFSKGELGVSLETYVAATEDVMVINLEADGKETVEGTIALEQADPDARFTDIRKSGVTPEGIRFISRDYSDSTVDIPTKAAVAMISDVSPEGSFTLLPGKPLTIVCAFSSNFKSVDCVQTVIDKVRTINGRRRRLAAIRNAHEDWWKDYWSKSYVSIPDPDIERQYYVSLYGMASCSRDPDFPPPLFGTWITKEPPYWMADYHLNYNHMAPYYALYSANRLEQADPYYAPLLAAIPRGEYYSEEVTGISGGILLPVGIGPIGIETTRWSASLERDHRNWIEQGNIEAGGMFWGQKSNSAYAVANMAMQFYRTWDKDYARKVYPFVKGVATFWENYLTREGNRYIILSDAIHEGTVGTMNPIASLGLVRMVMDTAFDMSEFLGVDEDRRQVWKERREHLSAFPLQERDGKKVFRYTEKGVDWWPDNTLGIQHIYPAGQIGLASDPELLDVARNTIEVMGRWLDFNGTNSFFPAAVRVGYPADSILVHLKEYSLHTYPNGFQSGNPHGTENWSTVPNTINEMLCMGHQDMVRLFPVWPLDADASFHQIRVEGAFLVSASLRGGIVGEVTVESERGRDLSMQNPWEGQEVEINGSDGTQTVCQGPVIRMKTVPGEYTVSVQKSVDGEIPDIAALAVAL
ncbi:MAG: hypothetical protein J6Y06_02375 [Bacteroidales bacterium]|nr:hypothetical protein [Bacteroidales bacterium]